MQHLHCRQLMQVLPLANSNTSRYTIFLCSVLLDLTNQINPQIHFDLRTPTCTHCLLFFNSKHKFGHGQKHFVGGPVQLSVEFHLEL